MPSLQELIYKLEVGEWVRYLKWVLVLLGLAALTAIYDIREFKNYSSPEAMDSAQLARNIAEGRGYTTQFIRPLSILLMQRQSPPGIPVLKEDHPDLANPPVYPFVLAGLMKALPFDFETKRSFDKYQPEVLIALFNQFLFFASAIVVFRLALRLFDGVVAWLSAIAFACADLYWRFSVSGLSTMLLVFLFLCLAWCLAAMEQNHREARRTTVWFLGMAVLAGLLTGIGGLTRYSFACLIGPVVLFLLLFFGARRLALAGLALLTCALVMAPWLMRNHKVSGHFFGTAGYAIYQDTEAFPANRLERTLSADLETELEKVTLYKMTGKLMTNLGRIVREDLPRLGGSWLAALFLASLLVPFRNPALGRWRWFVLMSLAALGVAQALGRTNLSYLTPEVNSENLLVIAAPAAFIFGAGLFFILLEQFEITFAPWRTAAASAFALVMCVPLILTLLPPRSYAPAWPPYWPPRVREVGSWFEKHELLMSDMPWAVAWYADRKCVWTTLDAPSESGVNPNSDFFSIYDYQKPISGLYLTHLTTDLQFFSQIIRSQEGAWGKFMLDSFLKKNVPSGFPLKYAMPGFVQDGQLFLADRPRWKPKSN